MVRTNAEGYDDVVAILRKEAAAHQSQLSQARDEAATNERKRAELERLVEKTKDSLIEEMQRSLAAQLKAPPSGFGGLGWGRELVGGGDELRIVKGNSNLKSNFLEISFLSCVNWVV